LTNSKIKHDTQEEYTTSRKQLEQECNNDAGAAQKATEQMQK
jgi:hypothetical protein